MLMHFFVYMNRCRDNFTCNQFYFFHTDHMTRAHCLCRCEVTGRLRLKRDGTRSETRFRFSAKRTSPFKWTGASVQSTTGSRSVRISGSNAGCTVFRGSVKSTAYPLHSPVSPLLPLPCVTVCHHISTGVYPGTNLGLGRLGSCIGR